MREFWVYILSNRTRVLYVGVTSDLRKRMREHKEHLVAGFTKRYNVDRLVHVERFPNAGYAIAREKQLKGLTRAKKVAIIEHGNPAWRDLMQDL